MRHFYAALIVLGIVLLLLPAMAAAAGPCYEDQPCWAWSKQGNNKRGVTVNGRHRVVGPCTYAKLAHAKRLDSATVRLRGDVWAHWICD